MQLYADEDFAFPVTEELRRLGHDVLTVQEDDKEGTNDSEVLARAHELGRVILTHNRRHFERLHKQGADHNGIVSATHDTNFSSLAARINHALNGFTPGRWCLRVNKSST
jgi:uncharacterized protein with PIN domain